MTHPSPKSLSLFHHKYFMLQGISGGSGQTPERMWLACSVQSPRAVLSPATLSPAILTPPLGPTEPHHNALKRTFLNLSPFSLPGKPHEKDHVEHKDELHLSDKSSVARETNSVGYYLTNFSLFCLAF